jgi:DNA-binding winged helix-turn-helix (wHTH) protein/predicted ATPase
MEHGHDYRFGPFRLDVRNERLWRGADDLVLRPKTFGVLSHLVRHAGDLVSRDELLEAVWPGVAVSEAVLTVCIGEIRQALGDEPQAARYVETLHRRGYRFIATVTRPGPEAPRATAPRPSAPPAPASLVGRGTELAQLERCLEAVRGGTRRVVFVTGEAGIGKTSLIDRLLDRAGAAAEVWCARGRCIAHYGAGEAYLPVLDALGRLGGEGASVPLARCLSRYAPTWLLQLPALSPTADDLQAAQRRSAGTGSERMLRELTEALEALTAERPLILALEDLHWSDYATLDLISWLARRQEPARLLLLGTYRPVDVIVRDHPLRRVKQELIRQGRCLELPLELLTATEVGEHLAARFGGGDVGRATLPDLARTIHRRTDGHPLFVTTLVDALVRQGWLVERAGRWEATAGIEAAAEEIPKSLQELVEQQFQQLGAEDQRLLEAASVLGPEGSAAAVAAALRDEVMAVEEQCTALARRGQFLHASGVEEWPDGTVAGRFRFRHTLYRQVVYDRLPVGRRVQHHARIAEREEAAYGAQAAEHAAELATHFEQGRAYARALHYRQQAAENATRRHAYPEAIGHLRGGLALLPRLSNALERAGRELDLQLTLGHALRSLHGPAAPAVGEAFARAEAACLVVGETPKRFAVLHGLRGHWLARAEVERARALGEESVRVAQRLADPAILRSAHGGLGTCLFYLGELVPARAHLAQSIADEHAWTRMTPVELDAETLCRTTEAVVLSLLGYPDQALAHIERGLALARSLGAPLIQARVLGHAAVVDYFRRDVAMVREHAESTMQMARVAGSSQWTSHATILEGWALTVEGDGARGIARMTQGLAAWRANEQLLGQPYVLALLAEAHGHAGQAEAGLAVAEEALGLVSAYGLRMYESELYRLKGELLAKGSSVARGQADACFRRAIDIARRQEARTFELRAALSLNRYPKRRGRTDPARRVLSEAYGWFSEGFDTGDLKEARALLEP